MSLLGRWNGVFYFVPLILAALVRLEFLNTAEAIMNSIIYWFAVALIVSTVASIIDRTLAPLRVKSDN